MADTMRAGRTNEMLMRSQWSSRVVLAGVLLAVVTAFAWVPVRCRLATRDLEHGNPQERLEAIDYLEGHRDRDSVLDALCLAAVSDESATVRQRAHEAADRAGWGRQGNRYLELMQAPLPAGARIRAARQLGEVMRGTRGGLDAMVWVGGMDESPEVREGVSAVAREWSHLVEGRARRSNDPARRLAAVRVLTFDETTAQLNETLAHAEPPADADDHTQEIALLALLDRGGSRRVAGLWRSLRLTNVPASTRGEAVRALARDAGASLPRFRAELEAAPAAEQRTIGASIAAADEDLRRQVGTDLLARATDRGALREVAAALDGLQTDAGEAALPDLDLGDALERDLLVLSARGSGLTSVSIDLMRVSRTGFRVRIPAGTIFVSSTKAQNMMVTRSVTLDFTARWKHEESLKAACAQIWQRIPGTKDEFEGRVLPPTGDLAKLAPLLAEASFPVSQAAVWIVASDVERKDLDHLRQTYRSLTLSPPPSPRPLIRDEHALAAVRLLEQAGLDVEQYKIHGWYRRHAKTDSR